MADERFAAFLFYAEDWLSSTAIDLMSAAEERGYLRLLLHAWKSPDCGLPNDDRALAHLSKLGNAWRTRSGTVLRAEFFERGGRLYNERLLKERENQKRIRQARSDAGKTGAQSRWHGNRISEPMTNASRKHWQNDASSSSSPKTKTNIFADAEVQREKERLLEALASDMIEEEELDTAYELCTIQGIERALTGMSSEDEEQLILATPEHERTDEDRWRLWVIQSTETLEELALRDARCFLDIRAGVEKPPVAMLMGRAS